MLIEQEFVNSDKRRLRERTWFKHRLSYLLLTVIFRLIAAVFNFSVKVVVVDRILD